MIDFIKFELSKIWRKRTFLLTIIMLLSLNLLMVWYTNGSHGSVADLSSYHKFQRDIAQMSEIEKEEYINTLYEDMQGIQIVNDVLNYKKVGNHIGDQLAKQMMEEHKDVYEKYQSMYHSKEFLKYTDSFEKELAFTNEIYEESRKVFGYETYKKKIKERKDTLNGVSVFSSANTDTFSSRNIEKEANDYARIQPNHLEFYPSKGLKEATQNEITDILLILSVILFSSALIYEEKEKKLFYVTRATKYGRLHYISAKIAALLIHCIVMTILFYLSNLLFFARSSGIGNLLISIQSYAEFMTSPLSISTLGFIILLLITKSGIMFFIGLIVLMIAIRAKQSFMPYLITGGFLLLNAVSYFMIHAQSTLNWLKYINVFGLLDARSLYGSYLNLNLMGNPVSRVTASITIFILVTIVAVVLNLIYFKNMKHFEVTRIYGFKLLKFKPHTSLLRHELFKSFITNKALIVAVFFTVLIGYQHLNQSYNLSPSEMYYQSIMKKLEGNLNAEKEQLITKEKERYHSAFMQIERIEQMESQGKIDEKTAESMKLPLYNETIFYPSFQKIMNQYDYVKENGVPFIYETGYGILFGLIENDRLFDYILLIACMLFMFSSLFAFEYQSGSWNLISSTKWGRKEIEKKKIWIALVSSLFITFVPFVMRYIGILNYCPMNQITSSVQGLTFFQETGIHVPIIVWIFLSLLGECVAIFAITMLVLILSNKLKNQIQVLFFSVLLLVVPPLLQMMELSYFNWISFLPLYDMNVTIFQSDLVVIYLCTAMLIIVAGYLYLTQSNKGLKFRRNKYSMR